MSMVDEELLSAVKMELREKEDYRKSAEHFANAFYKSLHRHSKSGRKILQLQNRIHTLRRKLNVYRRTCKRLQEHNEELLEIYIVKDRLIKELHKEIEELKNQSL